MARPQIVKIFIGRPLAARISACTARPMVFECEMRTYSYSKLEPFQYKTNRAARFENRTARRGWDEEAIPY
jgi:hypothetical protein